MDSLQEKTVKAIVNIFETGSVRGNYARVVVAAGDPGHLTYGRSQTTLGSGNLFLLIKNYCEQPQAGYAEDFRPYLERLAACDLSLDVDGRLRALLADAGNDSCMRRTQDSFFDEAYFQPALRLARKVRVNHPDGIRTALGLATVYDSTVHGSFRLVRSSTDASFPEPPAEAEWVVRYLANRRAWLANHANALLRKCVYRMDALAALAAKGNWELKLPITVCGVAVTRDVLEREAPTVAPIELPSASAAEADRPVLSLCRPLQTGDAVKLAQRGLVKAGLLAAEAVDGEFGALTQAAIRRFQSQQGLTPDGVVGPATWGAIEETGAEQAQAVAH